MEEILAIIGPEALKNLGSNWPFAAVGVAFMWQQWKALNSCWDKQERLLRMFVQDKLDDEVDPE